ncbi:uncharacterized protein LOC114524764 [Dendronephthya gigantea]|uniref:uncharacterized protein LOC114524764 n=1 Tax=Dendronephthya gigantea TaxID=151771 RepID=UPI00106D03C6|nr:uncharacterized protein LOC114524764 [Dendronephthya gigantea]
MEDEELKKRLNNSGYKNWLKVSRALIESKEALHDFTEKVIVDVHNDIKSKLGTGECTKTPICNTKKGKPPICASCIQWVAEIKTKKCDGQLIWKNANPQIWHNTHWEIAKCFMNDQGNKTNAAANTGPAKTDLSGLLNVLVNCKEFKLKHFKDNNNLLPKNVRNVRNKLMHCATMSFTDAEMQDMIDTVIALLEDDKELKHLQMCQEKVELIKSLRNSELELKPVDESECIRAALEAHAFAVESGEVDESMKLLYEKLVELIKGNKDLERKFDKEIKKINNEIEKMKQDSAAQFQEVHVTLGELKGQVQSLLKLANGEAFSNPLSSNACSALEHSEMKSFYKNALQSYAQKRKLDPPRYSYEVEGGKYISTVFVGERKFKAKEPKQSKKEADQSAAEEALRTLGNEDSELLSNKNISVLTEQQPGMSSEIPEPKDKLNYKNLLQERAQKKKILNPIYNNQTKDAGFISEVMYDGKWYSPEVVPQSRKVDAQQKAAKFVLAVLDSEEEKPELSSGNPSLPVPSQGDTNGKEMNLKKNTSKSFRVILNEHVQKVKKGLESADIKKRRGSRWKVSL